MHVLKPLPLPLIEMPCGCTAQRCAIRKQGSDINIRLTRTLVRYCKQARMIVSQAKLSKDDRARILVEHLESQLEAWQDDSVGT